MGTREQIHRRQRPSHRMKAEMRASASSSGQKTTETRYDINSAQFHASVARALRLSKKKNLISYDEIPVLWRTNPFIHNGYRFTSSTFSTLLSIFCLSNELVNIWTHLFPACIISWYIYSTPIVQTFQDGGLGKRSDAVVAGGFMVATLATLLFSTAWHTFRCNSRIRLMAAFVSVDIMSISIMMTSFSVLTTHLSLYMQPTLRARYFFSQMLWGITGMMLPWTNLFRPAAVAPLTLPLPVSWPLSRAASRVIFFMCLGIQGIIIPLIHANFVNGWENTSKIYKLAGQAILPMLIGSLIYGSKFPERRWPGKFDFIGCSHSIWHVASAMAAINACRFLVAMFEHAWEQGRISEQ